MKYKLFLIPSLCDGCLACMYACSLRKYGVLDLRRSAIKIIMKPEVSVNVCRHCDPAPCVDACPFNALEVVDGRVVLNEELCNSCKACLSLCPFNAIIPTYGGKFIKCDLCGGDPECVKVCPHNAIVYVKSPHKDYGLVKLKTEVYKFLTSHQ